MDLKMIVALAILALLLLVVSAFLGIIYHNIQFQINNVSSYKLDEYLDGVCYPLPESPETILQCDRESIWVNIIGFDISNNNGMTFIFQDITMDDRDAIIVFDYTVNVKNNIFVKKSNSSILILSKKNYSEIDIDKLQPIYIKFGRPLLSFNKRLKCP